MTATNLPASAIVPMRTPHTRSAPQLYSLGVCREQELPFLPGGLQAAFKNSGTADPAK